MSIARAREQTADRTGQGQQPDQIIGAVLVEHIFGAQANDMGGTLMRTIGLVRAKAKIGMKSLA